MARLDEVKAIHDAVLGKPFFPAMLRRGLLGCSFFSVLIGRFL